MTRNLITACILSLAFAAAASAQAANRAADNGKQLTQAEVNQLVREAHAPDQYKALASYYGQEQSKYLQLAADEKKEWERRSQNTSSIAAKYPRPVDSAKYLYEYYAYKASENSALEAKYSHLTAPDSPVYAQ
jgi:parvulin-like peptidyl-prolyl isomerase